MILDEKNRIEADVLACLLRDGHLAHEAHGLKPHYFSSLPNRIIFQTILDLANRNFIPDASLVIETLHSEGKITDAGGEETVFSLATRDCNPSNFKAYVDLLVDAVRAASAVEIASGLRDAIISGADSAEVISKSLLALHGVLSATDNGSVLKIADVVDETMLQIRERVANPGITGTSWGIHSLDTVTGGKFNGSLIVISGRPGMGKTAVMLNSALSDAMSGKPVILIEREMSPTEITSRFISMVAQVPLVGINRGILSKEELEKVVLAKNKISELPIYIVNSLSNGTAELRSIIARHIRQHNIAGVYVDYLQLLAEGKGDNLVNELGYLARMLKLIAVEHNIFVVALSQLNRGVEARDDKRPNLSDLRGSGNLEEHADLVIGLFRPSYYNRETATIDDVEAIIMKQRNGPIGTVKFSFNLATQVMQ